MKIASYRRFICTVLAILISITIYGIAGEQKPLQSTTYVVSDGDTLWSTASKYSKGEDVREVIFRIQQENDIENIIMPGQNLVITYKGEAH